MRNRRSKEFRELFARLPQDVQKQAIEAYRIFEENPYHPGLRFKCINERKSWYSVRVNKNYRAVGRWEDDTIIWFFIGTHGDYDHLL